MKKEETHRELLQYYNYSEEKENGKIIIINNSIKIIKIEKREYEQK